jgi:hypothetical protein
MTQLTSGITASAVDKPATFIRDPSNSSRTSQLENWQQSVGLATVEIPTTILASAGTPTATEVPKTVWKPTTHDFRKKFAGKLFSTAKSS